MIMAFCNGGKTLNLIRKTVEAALDGKMVLFINPELRQDVIAQRFYAYRDDDSKLANNINFITIPSGDAGIQYVREYLDMNSHYDLIAFDMPQIVTGTIDSLHSFIDELKTHCDVIFTAQAHRVALSTLENGESLPYMQEAFKCADTALFLIKANDLEDIRVEEHVITEFPINIETGEFDSKSVASYYIDIAENGHPRLNPFDTYKDINIWSMRQDKLLATVRNADNYV